MEQLVWRESMLAVLLPLMIVFGFLSSGFWLWMLRDAATTESDPHERSKWILIIACFHLVGALVYFFRRYDTVKGIDIELPSDQRPSEW